MVSTLSWSLKPAHEPQGAALELLFETGPGQFEPVLLTATLNHPAFRKATWALSIPAEPVLFQAAKSSGAGYTLAGGIGFRPKPFSNPQSTAEVLHLSGQLQDHVLKAERAGGGRAGLGVASPETWDLESPD